MGNDGKELFGPVVMFLPDIEMTFQAFCPAGSITEIRFLHPSERPWSLFPSSFESVREALDYSGVQAHSAYLLLNPVRRDVLEARGVRQNVLFRPLRNQAAADADIEARCKLLIDSDVVKPAGAAATEDQHARALEHSAKIANEFSAEGWPLPMVADSGNGGHTVYGLEMANDSPASALLSSLLRTLARRFDTEQVTIDTSVYNAARVTRLYGSRNQKAGRYSRIISAPKTLLPVTAEQIHQVIEKYRRDLGYKIPRFQLRQGSWTPELLEKFMDSQNICYVPPTEIPSGILYVLDPCPLNDSHIGTSPAILLTRGGWPKFSCKHASCQMTWKQFRVRMYRTTGKWFSLGKTRSEYVR